MPLPCLAGAVEPGVESGLLNGHRPLVLHLAGRCIGGVVDASDHLGRLGERQRCVRCRIGHLVQSLGVDVAHDHSVAVGGFYLINLRALKRVFERIALLMVAGVVREPGDAAVCRCLLVRLFVRISADDATGWDAFVKER